MPISANSLTGCHDWSACPEPSFWFTVKSGPLPIYKSCSIVVWAYPSRSQLIFPSTRWRTPPLQIASGLATGRFQPTLWSTTRQLMDVLRELERADIPAEELSELLAQAESLRQTAIRTLKDGSAATVP